MNQLVDCQSLELVNLKFPFLEIKKPEKGTLYMLEVESDIAKASYCFLVD